MEFPVAAHWEKIIENNKVTATNRYTFQIFNVAQPVKSLFRSGYRARLAQGKLGGASRLMVKCDA